VIEEESRQLLEYGVLVALALLVVWLALLILLGLRRLGAIPFGIASMFLVLMIPVFWLGPEIGALTILKVGRLRTSAEQAARYFAEIEKVRAKVEAEGRAVNTATISLNKEIVTIASLKEKMEIAQAGVATLLAKIDAEEQATNSAKASLQKAIADTQALSSQTRNRPADRQLTDDQVSMMANILIPFKGQEYGIVPYWEFPESLSIAKRIVKALKLAKWKYTPPPSAAFLTEGISGVVVHVNFGASEGTKKATNALLLALNNEGITASLRKEHVSGPADKIELSIGTKP
jgi:hypothetical protein